MTEQIKQYKLSDQDMVRLAAEKYEKEQSQKHKFPTERVDLPSKGLVYPKSNPLSQGFIEMKYMSAKEEDILANQNFINKGIVLEKLFQSMIVSPVSYNSMIAGDRDAIMYAARILGYGKDYHVDIISPFNNQKVPYTIDLTTLNHIDFNPEYLVELNNNLFQYTLPQSGFTVEFSLLTGFDEDVLKKMEEDPKTQGRSITNRLKVMLKSVNGDTDKSYISDFIDNYMTGYDSLKLRQYMISVSPGMVTQFEFVQVVDEETKRVTMNVPVDVVDFFWPRA